MAVRSSDQITIIDLTDGYSVILTNDSYVFPGTATAAIPGSTTIGVKGLCGGTAKVCNVDKNLITEVGQSTLPTGINVNVTGNNTTSPVITVAALSSPLFTTPTTLDITVVIDSDIEIHKYFGIGIAIAGQDGESVIWYTGTGITGTSASGTAFPNSGVANANVGDMYLNTDTGNVYKCLTGGVPATALWGYVNNIKGAHGGTWYTGTAISGNVGGQPTTYPSSGIAEAVEGDMYLNTSTSDAYICTSPGDPIHALWQWTSNIKGNPGASAISMDITSSNGIFFKNAPIATVLTAHVYEGGSEVTNATA